MLLPAVLLTGLMLLALALLAYQQLWQQKKHEIRYSSDGSYRIYYVYGYEQIQMPYATQIYLERNRFLLLLNEQEVILTAYCIPDYKWLTAASMEIYCKTERRVKKQANTFGIDVIYKNLPE